MLRAAQGVACQEWMLQGLFCCQAVGRVGVEKAPQEVHTLPVERL
jgi:hypothetical protein